MTWPHEEPFDTDIEGRWAQGRYDTPAQGFAGQRPHHEHDHHYARWRQERLHALDDDYARWCEERYRRFCTNFDQWRSGRADAKAGSAARRSHPPGSGTEGSLLASEAPASPAASRPRP